MEKVFRIGHSYKDILSLSKDQDQFVSWFSLGTSGIGNSGGVRSAKYLDIDMDVPCYMVLITRNTSHRWYNPCEDKVDYSSGTIFYWGDGKFDTNKRYNEFRGNKSLLSVYERVLDNKLVEAPPILHFSKHERGLVRFNGLCVLKALDLTWFEDKGNPVKNYRCELAILDIECVELDWLHDRVKCRDKEKLNDLSPQVWKDYIAGNIKKLDIWRGNILSKEEQLPPEKSEEAKLLNELSQLTPTQFEAVVVELFRNLPHITHSIERTRPTADGGFDFYGQFLIPYPVKYEISFLGEAKKYSRKNSVQPKHVSRLVARLTRGQYGIFVTTSYFTKQTQREVLDDGYPIRLLAGNDLVNFLKELRLVEKGKIKQGWLEAVFQRINNDWTCNKIPDNKLSN